MTVYRVSNYLDDCLYKLDVFFLVSDGVVRLADVQQSKNLLFLLNFSSSSRLLDRRAVLLASSHVLSPLCSCCAVHLPHVVNGGPRSCLVRTNVLLGQMSG